jgi:hypothetical protein
MSIEATWSWAIAGAAEIATARAAPQSSIERRTRVRW